MDQLTKSVLAELHINPERVPPESVRVLEESDLFKLGKRIRQWARFPQNHQALAYAMDTEHESPVGLVLRNLHAGELKSHSLITKATGPFWFNLHRSLPFFYKMGVGVLVEGPKDALMLWSHDIPAVACLGSAPTLGHLKTLARYLRVVFWIHDNDPPSKESELRIQDVRRRAIARDVRLIEFPIPVKDPAELYQRPEYFDLIKSRVRELSLFF
jgi:DNA primase